MHAAYLTGNSVKKGSSPKRLLVVDDHPIVRRGLVDLLAGDGEFAVVVEAATCADAMVALEKDTFNLVVADITLPDGDGIQLCRKIRRHHAGLPILIMSIHSEMLYADRALRAGANGYIMKHEAPEKIVDAIRQILSGNVHVSSQTVQRILGQTRRGRREAAVPGMEALTERELEVFTLIGQGRGTKEIAAELALGPKTVETHRLSIKRKLRVKHLPDLVKRAVEWNYVLSRAG
jgi:DNA-binding NarL/FixJ family response regulator